MANGSDPLQEEINRLLMERSSTTPLNPLQAEINRLMGVPSAEPDGGLLDSIGNIFGGISQPEGVLAAGAGAIEGALLDPVAALFEIPGLFTDQQIFTDQISDFFDRLGKGLLSRAEERALAAGLTPEEVAAAHGLGKFIGFAVPTVASIKAASILLRVPAAVRAGSLAAAGTELLNAARVPLAASTLVNDFAAGAIFGATLLEGATPTERLKHMAEQSAMFGAGRIIFSGLLAPFKAYKFVRGRQKDESGALNAILEGLERGEPIVIEDESQARSIFSLLTEENYIASSPAAQDILNRSASRAAIVQAVKDVAESRGSMGILRGFGRDLPTVEAELASFRSEFPGLKFAALKRGDEFDVFFGSKGLNNKQRAQFKQWGRFEGQMLWKDGTEYEFVSPAKRSTHIKVKRSDGKTIEIKNERITDLPYAREPVGPELDALYQDFKSWVNQNAARINEMRPGMTEFDIISGIRRGSIRPDDLGRRAFDVSGAITYPEELGLYRPMMAIFDENGFVEMHHWTEGLHSTIFSPEALEVQKRGAFTYLAPDGEMVVMVAPNSPMDDDFIYSQLSRMGMKAEGALVARMSGDPKINDQTYQLAKAAESLAREGTENISLLDPPENVTFEKIFEIWAKQHAIEGVDLPAARASFADRLRTELWAALPEEDRRIFESIREELFERIERDGLPLEAIAHMKGFHLDRLEGGRIRLRDINTGADVTLGSERVALEALKEVVRTEREMFGGMIPPPSGSMPSLTGGFDNSDGDWWFDGRVQSSEFLTNIPFAAIRNTRDYLLTLEERIGTRLFTEGFDQVDTGLSRMRNRYDPFAREIQSAWEGLSRNERIEVAEFWTQVEGTNIPLPAAVNLGRELGLSSRQLDAFRRSRALFDQWHQISGLPAGQYIPLYYTRIRKWADANGGFIDIRKIFEGEGVPPEFEFWGEMSRTGELAMFEMDPQVVMHKYIRGLLFKQEVKPAWDKLARLVGAGGRPPLRIRDLPDDIRAEVVKNAYPSMGRDILDEPVLPKPIRDIIEEYLTIVRGSPGTAFETMRRFGLKMYQMLGIEGDPRILEQFWATGMSTMYGAAMGARVSSVARNFVQNLWMLWPRLGSEHAGSALAKAFTREGFDEAIEAGAARLTEAGIPYGDLIFDDILSSGPIPKEGLTSMAVASSIRAGLRVGNVSRKLTEKLLIPFSSADHMSRVWAYHWQKDFTAKWLSRFESGAIGWERFADEGLPFFSPALKRRFGDIYRAEGREPALRFAGKMGADESNFIYGAGSQPAWMQRPFGRLLGMFGTWPLWAAETYFRRMKHGSLQQRMLFTARSIALTGAFANLTVQSGINFWNWIAPLSIFNWAGGPLGDYLIATKRVIEAPVDQKASALATLGREVAGLSFPGQMFLRDLRVAAEQNTPWDGALTMLLGRPTDEEHYAMRWLYNPELGLDSVPRSPEFQTFIQPVAPPSVQLRVDEPRPPITLRGLRGNR